MNCPACAKRRAHLYHSGCKGCEARAVARGPEFFHRNDDEEGARNYRQLLARVRLSPAAVAKAAEADKERTPA